MCTICLCIPRHVDESSSVRILSPTSFTLPRANPPGGRAASICLVVVVGGYREGGGDGGGGSDVGRENVRGSDGRSG